MFHFFATTTHEKENMKPEFIHRDGMIASTDYVQWLSDLKQRYRQSQIKAVVRINQSMLEFYWSLGRDIVALKAESKWGSGVLQQLSIDLQQMFPEEKGFSYTNIRYMKQWYSFYYNQVKICHQFGGELADSKWHQAGAEIRQQIAGGMETTNCQQVAGELEMPANFARIPWFHHVVIISKSNSLDEALFYIELGKGFSYVGRQMELQMPGGQTFFPDLIFYHIPQHRYVVLNGRSKIFRNRSV